VLSRTPDAQASEQAVRPDELRRIAIDKELEAMRRDMEHQKELADEQKELHRLFWNRHLRPEAGWRFSQMVLKPIAACRPDMAYSPLSSWTLIFGAPSPWRSLRRCRGKASNTIAQFALDFPRKESVCGDHVAGFCRAPLRRRQIWPDAARV
jgi:hypothetical protein